MKDEHLELFASGDDGQTWNGRGPVSLPKEIPADLLRLRDGSILLSYGSRLRGALGVHARISRDDGLTWDAPRVLFKTGAHVSSSGRRRSGRRLPFERPVGRRHHPHRLLLFPPPLAPAVSHGRGLLAGLKVYCPKILSPGWAPRKEDFRWLPPW